MVGSVNMDFRSQYLNFECGVYIYENPVVEQIKKDFDETLPKCVRMTKESVEAQPLYGNAQNHPSTRPLQTR